MRPNESRKNVFINKNPEEENRNTHKAKRKKLYPNKEANNATTSTIIELFKGELVTLDTNIQYCQF